MVGIFTGWALVIALETFLTNALILDNFAYTGEIAIRSSSICILSRLVRYKDFDSVFEITSAAVGNLDGIGDIVEADFFSTKT